MIEKKKKAVVIDDEPDILVYLSTALENNGFEVFSISNSNEGIRIIREYVPDLLCLDILMPGKTGLSIYNEIKKDKQLADIPVIIISGLNMKDDVLDENNSCYNK